MKHTFIMPIIGAAALCSLPYSLALSRDTGIAISSNEAHAVIGRPGTPRSVAGVARRSYRRAYRRGYYYGGYYAHPRPYVRYGYRTHPYIRRGYYGGY